MSCDTKGLVQYIHVYMYMYVGVYDIHVHVDMQCLIPRPNVYTCTCIQVLGLRLYLPDFQTTGEPIHDLYTHNHIESEPSMYNV